MKVIKAAILGLLSGIGVMLGFLLAGFVMVGPLVYFTSLWQDSAAGVLMGFGLGAAWMIGIATAIASGLEAAGISLPSLSSGPPDSPPPVSNKR